jgi:uncharacterized membrane protein
VALDPTGYGDKFAGIAPFQWLYILFVLVTVAIGVMGVRAVVLLIKGWSGAYRDTVAVLIVGVIVGGIHMAASRILRGGSMPVDMVVYTTVFNLLVFLFLGHPGIRKVVNFEKPSWKDSSGTVAAAIVLATKGLLVLTIQFLMAPPHTIGRINFANVWYAPLSLFGVGLILSGVFTTMCGTFVVPGLGSQARNNS